MNAFLNVNSNRKSYNLQALNFLNNSRFKIGILGGSFNPAHAGHLAISLEAFKKYKFDYIIWLVAKQNPFKPRYKHDIFERCALAQEFVKYYPKIIISSAEHDIQETESYYVLKALKNRFKNTKFTWLMGIDNIVHFKQWKRSDEIRKMCNILIFDRPAPQRMVNLQTLYNNGRKRSNNLIRNRLSDISSTYLRTQNNDNK